MASDLKALALRFCRELAADTGNRPGQRRSILIIGVRCRIRAPKELQRIVAHANRAGWLTVEGGRSVALTDKGRLLWGVS